MKKHIYPIVINNKLTNIEATSLYQALEISKEINRHLKTGIDLLREEANTSEKRNGFTK
jgi:hypothetical protein